MNLWITVNYECAAEQGCLSKDISWPERCAQMSLSTFNKTSTESSTWDELRLLQYKLGTDWLENSFAVKDSGIFLDDKLNMN